MICYVQFVCRSTIDFFAKKISIGVEGDVGDLLLRARDPDPHDQRPKALLPGHGGDQLQPFTAE